MDDALSPTAADNDPAILAFDAVCERLSGFEPGMDAEWVDGYLTALAASWRTISLEEALPTMCGDAFGRVFADPDDVARAMAALQGRLNVLRGQLDVEALYDDGETLRLAPLMQDWGSIDADELERLKTENDSVADVFRTGAWWGAGFFSALDDFAADWTPPRRCSRDEAEDHAVLRRTLELLVKDPDAPEVSRFLAAQWPAGAAPTRDDLVDEALFAVQELRLWWAAHPPSREPLRAAAAPGRNELCPCGSGRKYKKCCGAA